jgi:hypothetical protein
MLPLIFFFNLVWADEVPQSFQHLKKVQLSDSGKLYVQPKQKCNPTYGEENPVTEIYELCTLTIHNDVIHISFDNGPSDDPSFYLTSESTGKTTSFSGTHLYIPGGNNLYVSGWANSYYNVRKKFSYDGKKFTEVKQPFHYVGLKTTIKKIDRKSDPPVLVKLYADKSKKTTVAILSEGSEIEILVTEDNDWFLARTSFGLVGWVHVNGEMFTPYGLYFAGD